MWTARRSVPASVKSTRSCRLWSVAARRKVRRSRPWFGSAPFATFANLSRWTNYSRPSRPHCPKPGEPGAWRIGCVSCRVGPGSSRSRFAGFDLLHVFIPEFLLHLGIGLSVHFHIRIDEEVKRLAILLGNQVDVATDGERHTVL